MFSYFGISLRIIVPFILIAYVLAYRTSTQIDCFLKKSLKDCYKGNSKQLIVPKGNNCNSSNYLVFNTIQIIKLNHSLS